MRQAVIPAINSEANTSITTGPIDMAQVIKMSAQISAGSGTVNGTVQIQVSNDVVKPVYPFSATIGFTNWSNLGTATTVSASGTTLIAQQDMCYRALRVVYTDNSSGAGTAVLTVNLNVTSV